VDRLLFASTVINYIDRQTLSVLAPFLKTEYHLVEYRFRHHPDRIPHRVHARARSLRPPAR
jgi:hypothetical protein